MRNLMKRNEEVKENRVFNKKGSKYSCMPNHGNTWKPSCCFEIGMHEIYQKKNVLKINVPFQDPFKVICISNNFK